MLTSSKIIFADASYNNGIAGISCILTNNGENVLNFDTKKIKAQTPLYAELMAIRLGVQMAYNNDSYVLFTDSLTAANLVSNKSECPIKYKNLVSDIQRFSDKVHVEWISRENNKIADALSVFASRRLH